MTGDYYTPNDDASIITVAQIAQKRQMPVANVWSYDDHWPRTLEKAQVCATV